MHLTSSPAPPRRAFAAAVCVAALSSIALDARAGDERAAARYFEGELERIGAACATRAFDLVSLARGQGLHAFAVDEAYRLLLAFDPDHADAREYLGFVKKTGEWVRDPAAVDLIDRQNRRLTDESPAALGRRIAEWLDARAAFDRAVAAKLVELGGACTEKGYESQARRAYERALGVDADCAAAHAALGHVRVGDLWLSAAEKLAYERAAAGIPVPEQTPLESGLGAALEKSQSRHFRFQLDRTDVDLAAAARVAEATYTCFLADFGLDPKVDLFGVRRARLCVLSTPDAWATWVGMNVKESDRDAAGRAASHCDEDALAAGALRAESSEAADALDALLVNAARLMARRTWRVGRHPWLDAGFGAYYAMKIRGRTRVFGAAADPEIPAASASENWRPYVYELVRGRDDADLGKIAAMHADALDVASSVKSWAVVTWLMETDRPKFVEFLRALGDGDAKADAAALAVYGRNLFGLDRAWRAYALQSY
jgi:hypothetical protein